MILDDFGETISLELLDVDLVNPVHSWTFEARELITIGRETDRDVTILNPQVSRLHLELYCDIDGWRVKSLGRNGVLVDGEKVEESILRNKCIIRLGAGGPALRFVIGRPAARNSATITEQVSPLDDLCVDEQQKQREVEEIVDDVFFQQLKEQAGQMRRRT